MKVGAFMRNVKLEVYTARFRFKNYRAVRIAQDNVRWLYLEGVEVAFRILAQQNLLAALLELRVVSDYVGDTFDHVADTRLQNRELNWQTLCGIGLLLMMNLAAGNKVAHPHEL